jgi:hypothetical protein
MTQTPLETLSDRAEEAHRQLQQADAGASPMISIRRGLRDAGFPADAMNIDDMQSGKRILLVLHDDQPDTLLYQFTTLEREMEPEFEQMPLSEVSTETLLEWMQGYFAAGN